MKLLTTLLAALLLLSACQQGEDSNDKAESSQATTSQEAAETEKTTESDAAPATNPDAAGHDHDHDEAAAHAGDPLAASGAAFIEMTPEYACEKPLVIEFFAYQCPHCNTLEPELSAWLKKNEGKVDFMPVPTHLGHEQFGSLLLVHHAAKKLGVLGKAMPALFKRVHDEKKLFASPDEAAEFLVAFGADKDEALSALNDQKAIGDAIEADFKMMAKYKVLSVPRILVNHQYMTDISSAGGADKVFPLVDELLEKPHSCKL